MAIEIPAVLVAGDSLRLAFPLGDRLPSDGWSASLTLQPLVGGSVLVIDGIASVDEWTFAVSPTQSAGLAPGSYRAALFLSRTDERVTLAQSELAVLPNPASPGSDQRSAARRALDAIEAVLEGRAGSEDLEFTFADGRALKKIPHGELLALRQHYARLVARERQGTAGPRRVLVRL